MNRQPEKIAATQWLLRCCMGVVATAAAGCRVGPDYVAPEGPVTGVWHSNLAGGLTTTPSDPATLSAWWTTLGDPQLSSMIERAIAGNLDVRTATSRVRESRARRDVAGAALLPALFGTGSARVSRTDTNVGVDSQGEVVSAGFDAVWELDVFGGIHRSIEAAQADLQAGEEYLRDVLVTLAAETALNYVEVRTFQARLATAEHSLETQNASYELALWRSQGGLDDDLAVYQAKYNLEGTRSQIPTLRTGLEEAMNRLAVLLGCTPGEVHADLREHRGIPLPPGEIAVGVPAETLRRRPDVRVAERELAAQTARVGVAMSALYPQLTLTGSIGIDMLSLRTPLSARTWTIAGGPAISWAIFDPTVRPNIEVQSALQEQALIRYESTVLLALEEVENALISYAQELQRTDDLVRATQAAAAAAELAHHKYEAGLTDFTNVLDAERSLLSFHDQLHQSHGAVTSNVIRLYKALGGGWTSMTAAPVVGELPANQENRP